MLKMLQARLQQYVNPELPDVQAGFRKGRGTRDQIANIYWIIRKAREFRKNIYLFELVFLFPLDKYPECNCWVIWGSRRSSLAEEPKINLPTSTGSWKKQESSRKTSISALLTMPKPLTVWITINCGKF